MTIVISRYQVKQYMRTYISIYTCVCVSVHIHIGNQSFLFFPLAGEQLVLDYAEMEGVLLMTPFSFGAIPNFQADLEFETDLNIAAFITSPSQPPSTFNSSNQITSAETGGNATIVSILKSDDRLRALEACLDENSLVNVRVSS